jgi:hypothetical protein
MIQEKLIQSTYELTAWSYITHTERTDIFKLTKGKCMLYTRVSDLPLASPSLAACAKVIPTDWKINSIFFKVTQAPYLFDD